MFTSPSVLIEMHGISTSTTVTSQCIMKISILLLSSIFFLFFPFYKRITYESEKNMYFAKFHSTYSGCSYVNSSGFMPRLNITLYTYVYSFAITNYDRVHTHLHASSECFVCVYLVWCVFFFSFFLLSQNEYESDFYVSRLCVFTFVLTYWLMIAYDDNYETHANVFVHWLG